jgi:hypothetical protein
VLTEDNKFGARSPSPGVNRVNLRLGFNDRGQPLILSYPLEGPVMLERNPLFVRYVGTKTRVALRARRSALLDIPDNHMSNRIYELCQTLDINIVLLIWPGGQTSTTLGTVCQQRKKQRSNGFPVMTE